MTQNIFVLLGRSSILVCALLCGACEGTNDPRVEGQQPALSSAVQTSAAGAAYEHVWTRSKFDVGANPRSLNEGGYEKIVGSKGTFATNAVTRGVLAIPNAVAPDAYPRPYTTDPNTSNLAVSAYLFGSGVPKAEVVGMHVTTAITGHAPADGTYEPPRLLWYTSHCERAVSGIPVEGSYAYAALDDAGGAITEGIFWPSISSAVVKEALAMKAMLGDSAAKAAYVKSTKIDYSQVDSTTERIKIVHTSESYEGQFEAHAVYSVLTSGHGRVREYRHDVKGNAMQLPEELPSGAQDSAKVAR